MAFEVFGGVEVLARGLEVAVGHDHQDQPTHLSALPFGGWGFLWLGSRDVGAGVWLLLAAAADARIRKVWFDKTPHSLRPVFENPLHRNLHEAIIPGFALRWDLEDLASAMGERPVL